MRARFAASVLVGALIVTGTAGCAFVTPQATTKIVEASDGVNAKVGDVAIRNAIVISEDGTLGSLLVSFVNAGDQAARVTVQYEDGESGERVTQTVSVAGGGAITSFGDSDRDDILLSNVSQPGSLFPIYFQAGDAEGAEVLVPVLNTSLPEYTGLAPTPTPTPTETPTPTPTVEPSPEPTADTPAEPEVTEPIE
ncbi:hypothetical protein [Herbiconiux sp.]|uniref:hypothetical protein n=1 Tax=Herbiconiux sp. TaxID=1871186 RepID=UPI0025C4B572|nr:hypothetical protein [Herbiconiux sp.]